MSKAALLRHIFIKASGEPWRSRLMQVLRVLGYRDEQWIRVVMNRETLKLVSSLDTTCWDALEVSGRFWENRCIFKSYKSVHFPDFDICKDFCEEKFDIVFMEQVLEHVLRPYAACRNVLNMLKPGGYFLVTVPFLVRVHGHPVDCTRWTALGLKNHLMEVGFPIDRIHVNSWGNASCVRSNLLVWRRYHPVLHSLRNEPEFPINAWALAQKMPP